MVYTPEQVEEVKRQIFEQTKDLPAEQKVAIEEQVNKMSPEELELFVQQQMAGQEGQQQQATSQKGIFRMIVDGDIPSKKINENKEAIAVVSVKAVSKGHCLIIPKKPVGDANSLKSQAFSLARSVAKKIVSKLDAKSTEIQTETAFGETIINVIPIYDQPLSIRSPRYDASESELDEVQKILRVIKKPRIEKIKKTTAPPKKDKILKLRRRVP